LSRDVSRSRLELYAEHCLEKGILDGRKVAEGLGSDGQRTSELHMTELAQTLLLGLLVGAVYGLFSAGLSLAFGVLRIVNFAHGDFVMLGMFTAYAVWHYLHISIYFAVPIAIVGGAIISVPVYLIFFKRATQKTVHGQLVIALGLSLLIENGVLNVAGSDTKALNPISTPTWHWGSIYVPEPQTYAFVAAIASTIILELLLQRTSAGRILRAVVADREAAQTLGVRPERAYVWAFALSISLALVAGVVLFGYYPVSYQVGQSFILIGFICVTLGGIGDVRGAFVAGILVGVSESLVGTYWSITVQDLAAYAVFILGALFFPRGILGRAVGDGT
jgi:branched-chain amino acid transport system permease protein